MCWLRISNQGHRYLLQFIRHSQYVRHDHDTPGEAGVREFRPNTRHLRGIERENHRRTNPGRQLERSLGRAVLEPVEWWRPAPCCRCACRRGNNCWRQQGLLHRRLRSRQTIKESPACCRGRGLNPQRGNIVPNIISDLGHANGHSPFFSRTASNAPHEAHLAPQRDVPADPG